MEKKKIGIDIDEVIVEFIEGFLDYINLKNKTSFGREEITDYHLWNTPIHSSKEESIREAMEFQNSEFFDKINLVENAKESLTELFESYEIFFITSRPEEIKDKTFNFLKKHFPENSFNIVHSGEIFKGKTKAEICKSLGILEMIEDNADYALNCAENGIKTFILDKPWNQNFVEHENIIKVKNWNEILEKIK